AGIVRTERGRCRGGAGGEAPVPRGSVVHGVVEACRRDLPVRGGESLADLVADEAVAARGAEYRRQSSRVDTRGGNRLLRRTQGELHGGAGPAPLRRRQSLRRRQRGRLG